MSISPCFRDCSPLLLTISMMIGGQVAMADNNEGDLLRQFTRDNINTALTYVDRALNEATVLQRSNPKKAAALIKDALYNVRVEAAIGWEEREWFSNLLKAWLAELATPEQKRFRLIYGRAVSLFFKGATPETATKLAFEAPANADAEPKIAPVAAIFFFKTGKQEEGTLLELQSFYVRCLIKVKSEKKDEEKKEESKVYPPRDFAAIQTPEGTWLNSHENLVFLRGQTYAGVLEEQARQRAAWVAELERQRAERERQRTIALENAKQRPIEVPAFPTPAPAGRTACPVVDLEAQVVMLCAHPTTRLLKAECERVEALADGQCFHYSFHYQTGFLKREHVLQLSFIFNQRGFFESIKVGPDTAPFPPFLLADLLVDQVKDLIKRKLVLDPKSKNENAEKLKEYVYNTATASIDSKFILELWLKSRQLRPIDIATKI